jgi:acyl carrier protein
MSAPTLTSPSHDVAVIAEQIRAFLLKQFPLARSRGIDADESLLESGIVDSMGVLEVVGFIEQAFDIELTDEDLLADTFESISSLAEFLAHRLSG